VRLSFRYTANASPAASSAIGTGAQAWLPPVPTVLIGAEMVVTCTW